MVGQKDVLNYIDKLTNNFPGFVVLVGPKGSGKRMIARHIADKLYAVYSVCGIKVDDIRYMIDTASVSMTKTVYCIEDADLMRNEAKNALLKITEEPPKNAYFIMTVSNEGSVLDTIASRATVIRLQPYTKQELFEYWDSKYANTIWREMFCDIATTPHELDLLSEYGSEFMEYVNLVVDNIAEVESANAFKSSTRLSLKSGAEGYDLKVFWETFVMACFHKVHTDPLRYAQGIKVTCPYIDKLTTRTGINLQQLYDMWVFDIRKVWL